MTCYRADWVLPIAGEPMQGASVTVADGRIAAVGPATAPVIDCGRVALLPSLVNAHTHLELSHLHGRIPPAGRFTDWIRAVMQARRGHADPADPGIVTAVRAALRRLRAGGTGLVGDISNSLVSVPLFAESGVAAHVFYELLGFNTVDPAARVARAEQEAASASAAAGRDVRIGLAPHAPYSVSPDLFRCIRAALDARPSPVSTVHLGESADEIELLRHGTGALRELLEDLGVWTHDWRCPGVSPVEYLSELGFLDGSVVAVHAVQCDGEDLSRLAALGVTVVACPRSNRYVGVGSPPLEAFYAMEVDVAFGTDSLASAGDLSVFQELAEARRIAPRVPARRLLESATLTAARALRFDNDFGSLEPGKRASIIAVSIPAGVTDVEEYLVSGVREEDVRWIE